MMCYGTSGWLSAFKTSLGWCIGASQLLEILVNVDTGKFSKILNKMFLAFILVITLNYTNCAELKQSRGLHVDRCVLFAGVGASPGHVPCFRSVLAAVRGGFQTAQPPTQSWRQKAGGRTGRWTQGRVWAGSGAVAELACGGRRILFSARHAAVA